jgi:hypothetical protein
MEDARNLKFKSEILPRDFVECIIKFRRTRLCGLKCRYALKFHYVLTSRHTLKFCRALKFRHVLKYCRAVLNFLQRLDGILCREILRSGFYLSNFIGLACHRACIDQASIEFCLAKFEREILKFRVTVISGILR